MDYRPERSWSYYHGWKLSLAVICLGVATTQHLLVGACSRFLHIALVAYLLLLFYRVRTAQDRAWPKLAVRSPLVLTDCAICVTMKPPRFYHCRSCNRCRFRLDHHCEWLGTCIYATNLKLYVQCLVVGLIFAAWSLIMLVGCIPSVLRRECSLPQAGIGGIISLLAIVCLLEMYRLLRDQYEALRLNQTLIESYKRIRGRQMSLLSNCQAMFGESFIEWLTPTNSKVRANILEPTFSEDESLRGESELIKAFEEKTHPSHRSLHFYEL